MEFRFSAEEEKLRQLVEDFVRAELIPLEPMKKARGFLKGIDTRIDREADRV